MLLPVTEGSDDDGSEQRENSQNLEPRLFGLDVPHGCWPVGSLASALRVRGEKRRELTG